MKSRGVSLPPFVKPINHLRPGGSDGLDRGRVRRGRFDCCALRRNCADTDG
jgi:hypothetical protein